MKTNELIQIKILIRYSIHGYFEITAYKYIEN